jgi:hypothetical protein
VPGAVARVRGARGRAAAAGQPGRVPAAGPPGCGGRRGRRCGPAAARGVPRRGCRAMRECSTTCHTCLSGLRGAAVLKLNLHSFDDEARMAACVQADAATDEVCARLALVAEGEVKISCSKN